MDPKKDAEKLAELIDEMSLTDTVEQKMNDFARDKERKRRIERARQSASDFQAQFSNEAMDRKRKENQPINLENLEIPSMPSDDLDIPQFNSRSSQETPGIPASPTMKFGQEAAPAQPSGSGSDGGTQVFSMPVSDGTSSDAEGTRIIREDDLSQLQKEMEEEERKPKPKTSQIALYVLGGLLAFGLVVGGLFLAVNMFSAGQSEESSGFSSLLAWAESWSALDDEEKQEIIDWEATYKKLTDSQKEEISQVLKNQSGMGFDQLLAKALAAQKNDTSSDNREIAEQKAKLRNEINYLQGQIDVLQGTLSSLEGDLNAAREEEQNAGNRLSTASSALEAARSLVEDTQNAIASLQSQLNSRNASLAEINQQLGSIGSSDDAQFSALIEQKNQLEAEIGSIQTELNSSNTQLPGYQANASQAEIDFNDAQSAYDQASGKLQTAQNTFDAQARDIQDQISTLESQIEQKKEAIEALSR